MQYDPIKDRVATLIAVFPCLRAGFYRALHLLLLRQRYVTREITAHATDNMSFYDAGAGFCQYSDFVLKRYPHARVFATDLKTDYLGAYAAQAKGSFSFQSADLQDFIPKARYDMAIAIDILEHIERDDQAIANIYEALPDGGVFIISTPSDMDEAAAFTAEHVRPGYNKKELEQKLIAQGFEIEKSIYTYGFWGALSWRLMLKYPLKMLGKSKFLALALPLWYLIVYPFAEIMMQVDLSMSNSKGTGILIVVKKIDR
ncbi:MAG TPA: class I SAM-dependent methyltransferase [Candidatus Cloacimonadota bacterium]|nr:class I SAM-dependent methyltransferase [Candidatus Cloacimonadota bacterium]